MQSVTLKFGLSKSLTVGSEVSVGRIDKDIVGSASGIIEWRVQGITMGLNAGSYFGDQGYNPFARISIQHYLKGK